ncbi:hypothetical protein L1887_11205 [Cichorium endivia]|nr:hypothetical protein L1887_11205 [Cichorium endivia]
MESGRHSSAAMEEQKTATRKKGGWKSIKYIIGNESFEKLASMSLIANMTVYLRSNYNMSGIFLINVVTIWMGTSNISTLAGAFISDAYIGRFLTLLFASIVSLLGMSMMTLTAGVPHLRPPKCNDGINCMQPENWQLGLLFAGLGLLALGAGGLRPCGIAFGADQFDTTTAKGKKQLESFFNLWYLSFTVALIVALTGVVYIQTNISWVIGFAIPTACLLSSFIIFLIGRHTYVMKKPVGSVLSDIIKVIVASIRKRKMSYDDESRCSFYYPLDHHQEESGSKNHNLVRTQRFKCFDKAAMIIDPSELNSNGVAKNKWRLCNVQQVENLKCVVGILPIWVSGTNGRTPWLGGHDLNNNRLDYYYYIVAGFGVLNLIYFTFFGSKYVAPAKVIGVEEESQQVEDGGDGRNPSGASYHEV